MKGKTSKRSGRGVTKPKRASSEDGIIALKQALEEKDKIASEYLERLRYLQAEFDNYRKGVEKEKGNIVRYANEGLILKLLDVYESLERALENGRNDKESLYEGVIMIHKEFKRVLEKEGVSEIKAVGEKFDPFKHEALNVEKDDTGDPNTIIEEYQRGYMLGDKVIRYSKVKVNRR